MEFIPGTVIINKTSYDELDNNFYELDKMVNSSGKYESMLYFSQYLQQYGGPQELVVRTLLKASDIEPNNPWIKFELSKVFAINGKTEQALAYVKLAIQLSPTPHHSYFEHMEKLIRILANQA
jgi:tetratricopeptide (TPR) repeat protein